MGKISMSRKMLKVATSNAECRCRISAFVIKTSRDRHTLSILVLPRLYFRTPSNPVVNMKLSTLPILFTVLSLGVNALAPQKQVLITFPNDTPDSALNEAKGSIEEAVSPDSSQFNQISADKYTKRVGRFCMNSVSNSSNAWLFQSANYGTELLKSDIHPAIRTRLLTSTKEASLSRPPPRPLKLFTL